MADLPANPSLDHLRRQARDLLRAARVGDTTAAGRIRAVADALTLASAQLAVAREYGFASWTRLRDEVTARTRAWPVRRKHSARPASVTARAGRPDGVGRHRQRRITRQPPPPRLDRHRASPARRGRLSPGHHPVTR